MDCVWTDKIYCRKLYINPRNLQSCPASCLNRRSKVLVREWFSLEEFLAWAGAFLLLTLCFARRERQLFFPSSNSWRRWNLTANIKWFAFLQLMIDCKDAENTFEHDEILNFCFLFTCTTHDLNLRCMNKLRIMIMIVHPNRIHLSIQNNIDML
jgi:hypothetical protein